ncbi:MAG: SDR family oxidoreductase [Gammaproteobacteria bacterium]|nr:SDR family oxidoreductase [Gammaproteobacteria bacterium]
MKLLITGVSSGIGLGVAQSLHELGHEVIGIDRQPVQDQRIAWHELDLSCLDQVSDYVDHSLETYDALIYCAGIREICNPVDLSLDQWRKTMDVNVNACFLLAQALIKRAIHDSCALNIVNIASISGLQVEADRAAYVTSKFALIGLTRQLAFQFGNQGIRSNAIAPGIIETPLTAEYFKNDTVIEKIKNAVPLGGWGQVHDIVPLVEICLNNQYMNGSVLVCDGGWTTGKSI